MSPDVPLGKNVGVSEGSSRHRRMEFPDSGVRKVTHLTNKGEQWKTKRHTLLNIGVQQTELTTDIDISFSYYFFPLLNQTHLNSHFLWGGGGGSLGARVT